MTERDSWEEQLECEGRVLVFEEATSTQDAAIAGGRRVHHQGAGGLRGLRRACQSVAAAGPARHESVARGSGSVRGAMSSSLGRFTRVLTS